MCCALSMAYSRLYLFAHPLMSSTRRDMTPVSWLYPQNQNQSFTLGSSPLPRARGDHHGQNGAAPRSKPPPNSGFLFPLKLSTPSTLSLDPTTPKKTFDSSTCVSSGIPGPYTSISLINFVLVSDVFSAISLANPTAHSTVSRGVGSSLENSGLTSGSDAR